MEDIWSNGMFPGRKRIWSIWRIKMFLNSAGRGTSIFPGGQAAGSDKAPPDHRVERVLPNQERKVGADFGICRGRGSDAANRGIQGQPLQTRGKYHYRWAHFENQDVVFDIPKGGDFWFGTVSIFWFRACFRYILRQSRILLPEMLSWTSFSQSAFSLL